MPNPKKINNFEAIIGSKIKVTTDKKSGSRVINFPFEFPSDDRGMIIICKIKDEEWYPFEEIDSISINFK